MVSYNRYLNNSINYVDGKLLGEGLVNYKREYIPNGDSSIDNKVKDEIKEDGENTNSKDYLKGNNILQEELGNECNDEDGKGSRSSYESFDNINNGEDAYNSMNSRVRIDSLEDYYDNKESEQSVFKISTGKIMESLTISDKIKLLYVSMQLGKENYKKVEAHLYAENAAEGVLNALKLLREELSEKEYKKVRKVAGKFIDMDAAERLY